MRIGYLAGELSEISSALAPGVQSTAILEVLAGIRTHYRRIGPAQHKAVEHAVLNAIDRALSVCAAEARSEELRSVILLAGLRQLLFPQADAFGSVSYDR
jgi:hypothetical protein